MKFVIGGRTFDTTTGTRAARRRSCLVSSPGADVAEEIRQDLMLYRTRKGVFFVHKHATIKRGKGKPMVTDSAFELTAAQAAKWVALEGASVMDATGLRLPGEA